MNHEPFTEPLNPNRGHAPVPGAEVAGASFEGPLPEVEPHDGHTIQINPGGEAPGATVENSSDSPGSTGEERWQVYPDLTELTTPYGDKRSVTLRVGDTFAVPDEGGWTQARVDFFKFSSDGQTRVEMTTEDGRTGFLRLSQAVALKDEASKDFAPPDSL